MWLEIAKSTPRNVFILVFPEKYWNFLRNASNVLWSKSISGLRKIPLKKTSRDFPSNSAVKNPSAVQDTQAWSPGQKFSWRRAGNPLRYPCLENPMDRGAWWAAVHAVTERRTGLKGLGMRRHPGQSQILLSSAGVMSKVWTQPKKGWTKLTLLPSIRSPQGSPPGCLA